MTNFGFTDLGIVAPHQPVWEEAKVSAVGAEVVLRGALVVQSIVDAVADCTLVIGTAGGRSRESIDPERAVDLFEKCSGKTALVFGSEKSGLTNAELSHCHQMLTIPTRDDCPSLNLGQAVAICCYELSRGRNAVSDVSDGSSLSESAGTDATMGEIEQFLRKSVELMKMSGYFAAGNERRLTEEFRQSLLRARPTKRELSLWLGALDKIEWKIRRSPDPNS